jgi:hypothetical protein
MVMAHFLVRDADVFMCTICKSGSVFLFTDSSTFQWRCVAEVEVEERQVTVSGRRFEGGRGRWGWLSDGRQFLPASVCPHLGKCENL